MVRTQHHQFITFNYETEQLTPDMWISLGEAMSKSQHLAGVPLKPAAAETMMRIALIRGLQATTAIEGNTLSQDEVGEIVAKGTANVPPSLEYQEQEVKNVLVVLKEIDLALAEGVLIPITVPLLCKWNAQVLNGTADVAEVVPGQLRPHNVTVGKYVAPHWQEVPALLDELCGWLRDLRARVDEQSTDRERFVCAVTAAMLAHLYVAWIHPFGDGNGRVARLLEVLILSESGVVPVVATNLLSDHYNKTRPQYYKALDRAQSDVTEFIRYALQGFLDELRVQIAVIRAESRTIHWESYVYETFREHPSTMARDRQRELALTMPSGRWISPNGATELNPGIAKKYAVCGPRTPTRDLNDLTKMGLVVRKGRRYRANRKVIEAFVPPTWSEQEPERENERMLF